MNNSSVDIITYNVQRDHSGNTVSAVGQLVQEHPTAVICLQEVTEAVGRRLSEVFPTSSHQDENMIIAPPGAELLSPTSHLFGSTTRSFLITEMQQKGHNPIRLLTGKLRHGLSFLERYMVLREIFQLCSSDPTLLALDTNCILPGEFRIMFSFLSRHGFGSTHHPEGTHDKRRLEHSWGRHTPVQFARSELDRILFSSHFGLSGSSVIPGIISSDHEPVVATLNRLN